MNPKFFINSILLGVGLAMDAFSVSLANGLSEPGMSRRKETAIAGTYAAFQILMPLAGWVCVHTIVHLFRAFQKFIPWIALFLLLYIGGKMLADGIRDCRTGKDAAVCEAVETEQKRGLTPAVLVLQGIATSIDALSVGFTIAEYDAAMALTASLLIGAVTYAICAAGVKIGKKFGTKLAGKAQILGGCILILIGLEIFLSGVKF